MNTPQTAIIPDTIQAAIYIEANIQNGQTAAIKEACRKSLQALSDMQAAFPDAILGLTIGFGASFWQSLNHADEGREIKPFTPLGRGLCPETQCDLLIHIQSLQHNINFALAQKILAIFGNSIRVESEHHGFRLLEERGVDGFVDGTENPHGEDDIRRVGIIADGADAGGSYVLLQKYLHNLHKWQAIGVEKQEASVGRSKADNIEFDRSVRLPDSHLGRTNIKENGVGLKIVRRSLPFGTVSGEHGLMFIAYCATLHNIEAQLLNMFGETDGQIDLLLKHLTTAVRSAYYFAPSVERLYDL